MVKSCAVRNCVHNAPRHPCQQFTFPKKDDNLLREWARLSGNPKLIDLTKQTLIYHRYVCECHFTDDDFLIDDNGDKKGLKLSAFPSLNLPHPDFFLPIDKVNSMLQAPARPPKLATESVERKLVQTELPKLEIISTVERVPSQVQQKFNTVQSKSTLKRSRSGEPTSNNCKSKKQKLSSASNTNNDLIVETPSLQVDRSGPIIPMADEALILNSPVDLNGELLPESPTLIGSVRNESTSAVSMVSLLDPVTEIQPDPCIFQSTPCILKRRIPIEDVTEPTQTKKSRIKKPSNLHVLLLGINDDQAPLSTPTNPNHGITSISTSSSAIDNDQLDSTNPTEISISPGRTERTQSVNRYSSSVTTRSKNQFGLRCLLLRGAINQLRIVLRLKRVHSRKTLHTLLEIHKLINRLLPRKLRNIA